MFDITFTKEFDSLGIPAILVIAIMFFLQFIYQYIIEKNNQKAAFQSKNEYANCKEQYEIYKMLYFNLVKNIENNADIDILNNNEAQKFLISFCKFNMSKYDKKLRFLSDALMKQLYEFKNGSLNEEIAKKIKKQITNDFENCKKKMGLPYTENYLYYWNIAMYTCFFVATTCITIYLLLLCVNSNKTSFINLFLGIGMFLGLITIIICYINIVLINKNKR